MKSRDRKMLKIGELARQTGCPVSTIRHYINEGLIDPPVLESRNMAYYPKEAVPKVSLAKRLQTELFLPLKIIKKFLKPPKTLSFEEYKLFVEVRDRLRKSGDPLPEICTIPASEILKYMEVTEEELLTLEKLQILSPQVSGGRRYYSELDFRVLKAYSDCRKCGFSQELGFTAEDAAVYADMIRNLVQTEFRWFLERMAARMSAEQVVEVLRKGVPALNELIAGLHHKVIAGFLENLLKEKRP